jgi:hypothetical protein
MKNRPRQPESPDLYWVEEITRFMDSKFRIPGTNFRFGLDPLLGLFPVVGDFTSFAISGGLVLYMLRHGASRKVIILMLLNIFLDATIGSIPIIGHVFDFYYKANTRNINLLRKHYKEGQYQGSGTWIVVSVAIVLVGLLFLIFWGLWKFFEWAIAWWQ